METPAKVPVLLHGAGGLGRSVKPQVWFPFSFKPIAIDTCFPVHFKELSIYQEKLT
jgi:hypothetical protein